MPNNLPVKDANNLTQTLKTTEVAGLHTPHHHVDSLPALPPGSAVIGRVGLQVAGVDLAPANPLPVTGGLTDAQLRAAPLAISGNVGISGPVAIAGTVATTGTLTDAQLRASPVPVSVSGGAGLTNSELRASPVPVSGMLAVTGALTDAQLRAAAIPVSGTVGISGTVPVSGPATDAQMRASPLPVSGTVAATGPLTDAQLRASPPAFEPVMSAGGHVALATAAAGANFTPFAAQVCAQLTICNDTGVTIEIRQGGAGVAIPVFDRTYFTLFGLTNASQIEARRADQAGTSVTVKARWEA
jgi:hypothetical protein